MAGLWAYDLRPDPVTEPRPSGQSKPLPTATASGLASAVSPEAITWSLNPTLSLTQSLVRIQPRRASLFGLSASLKIGGNIQLLDRRANP